MATSKTPGAKTRRTTTKPSLVPDVKTDAVQTTKASRPTTAKPATSRPAPKRVAARPAAHKPLEVDAAAPGPAAELTGVEATETGKVFAAGVAVAESGTKSRAKPVSKGQTVAAAAKAGKAIAVKKEALEDRLPTKTATRQAAGKRVVQAVEKGKEKREKVVRDSFSMPKTEHAGLKALRTDLARAGRICTKSELLRAGLRLVSARSVESLVKLLDALPAVPKGKSAKK